MKKILVLLAMTFVVSNAFSQAILDVSTGVTLLPSATATRLLETAIATSLSPFASTLASAQARGVAGKEQLKDELVALNDDMMRGEVRSIDEVRQPALRELFIEISQDEAQMAEIHSVVEAGSELHKIATAVTVSLMLE